VTAPRHPFRVTPRFMRPAVAAEYLGISESQLRKLPIGRRRMSDGIVGYMREDLDGYLDELPYDGGSEEDRGCDDIDKAFGL
jgi:hypothetical protein